MREVGLAFLDRVSWWWVGIAVLTLGLAPFFPRPHFFEKVQMLASGTLRRPIDWFDLVMHGTPWAILVAKVIRTIVR